LLHEDKIPVLVFVPDRQCISDLTAPVDIQIALAICRLGNGDYSCCFTDHLSIQKINPE